MTELYSSIKDQNILLKYGLQYSTKPECGHSLAGSNSSRQAMSLFPLSNTHSPWEKHDSVHNTALHAYTGLENIFKR